MQSRCRANTDTLTVAGVADRRREAGLSATSGRATGVAAGLWQRDPLGACRGGWLEAARAAPNVASNSHRNGIDRNAQRLTASIAFTAASPPSITSISEVSLARLLSSMQ